MTAYCIILYKDFKAILGSFFTSLIAFSMLTIQRDRLPSHPICRGPSLLPADKKTHGKLRHIGSNRTLPEPFFETFPRTPASSKAYFAAD